ncbi:MAG: YeeE/YedE [Proteobacteria bacterium]|nr:YeeE/YedE [Pseudomonadota bacterium]
MIRNARFFDHLATLASGTLFGFGLAWSTMIRPESVLAFLTFQDLGLLLVLGSAVGLNLLIFQALPKIRQRALLGGVFQQRPFSLDKQSLAGGVLFGLGWGICGICPGPALAGLGAGNGDLLIALASIFAGAGMHGLWVDRQNRKAANVI